MIATDVNFEKLKELKQERPVVVIDQLDVTKGTDVERMFKEKYLDVNVLFNCAGCVGVCVCVYTLVQRERERAKGRKEGRGIPGRECEKQGQGKKGRKEEDVMETSRTYCYSRIPLQRPPLHSSQAKE